DYGRRIAPDRGNSSFSLSIIYLFTAFYDQAFRAASIALLLSCTDASQPTLLRIARIALQRRNGATARLPAPLRRPRCRSLVQFQALDLLLPRAIHKTPRNAI